MLDLDALDFTKGNGLITVVTIDARTSEVLMVTRLRRGRPPGAGAQQGPACHTGQRSCFGEPASLDALAHRCTWTGCPPDAPRRSRSPLPAGSRAIPARLLSDRNFRLKKLGEEMAELVTACADGDKARASEEGADVLYHVLVALRSLGVSLDDMKAVLKKCAAPKPAGGS